MYAGLTGNPVNAFGLSTVNVGVPQVIGRQSGREVVSSIARRPLPRGFLRVGLEGIDDYPQADTSVHGGPNKALCACSLESVGWWEKRLGLPERLEPGSFGENLTVWGANEGTVCVGEIWLCGDVVLEVTKPRTPCYKLDIHLHNLGVPEHIDMIREVKDWGRAGWCLRVIQPGKMPTCGVIEVIQRPPGAISIADAYKAKVNRQAVS